MKETTITIDENDIKNLIYIDMHKRIRKEGDTTIIITIPENQYNIAYLFVLLDHIYNICKQWQCKNKNIIVYEDHYKLPEHLLNDILEILMTDRKPIKHMISTIKFIKRINIKAEKNINDNNNDLI